MGLMIALFLLIVLIGLGIIVYYKQLLVDDNDQVWPFYAKKPLSPPEQVLYFRLVESLPEHIILAQVQLSRILGVKKGEPQQSWLNRINRMSVDFVVCHRDASIVAVIELDDPSHQKQSRQLADAKKDKALSAAQIKVVRWQTQAMPNVLTIQSTLLPKPSHLQDKYSARPKNHHTTV